MRSEFSLIDRSPDAEQRQQTEPSNNDADRIREVIDQTRNDAVRTRTELDRHIENCDSGFRRVHVLWGFVFVLALGLLGASWYVYSDLTKSRPLRTDVPAIQELTGKLADRLASIEGSLTNWAIDRASIADQMATLETKLSSNVKSAGSQAQMFATDVGRRVREEVNRDLGALKNRVAGVESVQRETQDHVSQLQSEVGDLRQEVAGLKQQNAQQLSELQQVSEVQQAAKSDMDRVNNQMSMHTNRLDALNNKVDRQRVEFEVADSQTHEVASGIYLTLKSTDLAHQRVDGWMQLASEGRILWIRGLGAQEPYTFVTRADNRPQALVFTHIGQNSATGYLLLPVPVETASQPSSR